MNSLRVDENLLMEFVRGKAEAVAIVEAWKFHEPVTLMSSAELDALSARTHTTFNFPRTDRNHEPALG